MTESKRKKIEDVLRNAINQQMVPHPAPPAPESLPPAAKSVRSPSSPRKQAAAKAAKPGPQGRGVQFYLTQEDRKIIYSLATWFGSQDRRVSDSQVIKAVIRAAKHNSELLAVCDEVIRADRRRQKRRPE